MSEPAPASQNTPETKPPQDRQELILSIIGASILLFAAVAIIVFLGLRGIGSGSTDQPTPTNGATSTSPTSLSLAPSCETIINSGSVQVSVALPVSTTVKDTQFRVESIVPRTDAWAYPSDRSEIALWVCGTVVNYVIGLEPTPQNEALLTSLAVGDRIQLQLANGTLLPFRYTGRQDVPAGDDEVLAQRQPRLTLLLAEDDVWQVAVADYVAEEELVETTSSEPSAQLGQPVRIGDARITVTRGHAEQGSDLPSGAMYYLVEFSVDNLADAPLSTSAFSMRLQDGLGNTYLVSPSASRAGEHGPLSGDIPPGASAQATAGYLVPNPLPEGSLIWIFSPRPELEIQARIGIPYEGAASSPSPNPQINVTVEDAFIGTGGGTLVIVAELRNGSPEPLVVESNDVSLASESGTSQLITEAPPLPWSIEPGQARVVELQYQKPAASEAVLELLGYSFEIAGLP